MGSGIFIGSHEKEKITGNQQNLCHRIAVFIFIEPYRLFHRENQRGNKQGLADKERTVVLKDKIRFAAVGDLHCTKESSGRLRNLFLQAAEMTDAMLLCGDLTDYGLAEEAHVLVEELSVAKIPIVAVLGNHDFESGEPDTVRKILGDAGVRVLDGEVCEIHGVGIAGVKGFAGGYGHGALGPWGEKMIKEFVNEAIREAIKLESALAKLRTAYRIAMLHYSPVVDTVKGEPPEIYPFLGTSRLEDPLIHHPVNLVIHGHAHRGSPEGKTLNNIPVYNVAKPLLERTYPGQPPFRIIEVPVGEAANR
jgi:Icc-related predicted phosphoesterase